MEKGDYISMMQRKENQCRAWLAKADEEYLREGCHTKDEGRYLQEATKLQYEMAQLSDGEERRFHQRRVKDLSLRLEEVLKEVSPETYLRVLQSRNRAGSKVSDSADTLYDGPDTDEDSKGKAEGDDELDPAVSSWFKPMPSHSFADVAGMNDLQETLRECIEDAHRGGIRAYLKMSQLHSYFFIGPPGCGKTYIIEAFAHELMEKNYTYLSLDGSDILSRYVGDAEKIIAKLFEQAEKNAPCIVFIDEIDGVCKNRSLPDLPVWASSMTTAFLTAYNRIHSSDKNIIFIGATNYPNQVDNAMLDRVRLIRVPFPDKAAREHAFRLAFEEIVPLGEDITFTYMSERCAGYNYRDIDRLNEIVKEMILKDLLNEYHEEQAAIKALKDHDYHLTKKVFDAAQADYTPSPKDAIIRELDEWEARFLGQKELEG
ncbi:MAG: ATP-binding protein [Eubacterium sp.]|nr:ATP-binding protein [Eubacterium sp.]